MIQVQILKFCSILGYTYTFNIYIGKYVQNVILGLVMVVLKNMVVNEFFWLTIYDNIFFNQNEEHFLILTIYDPSESPGSTGLTCLREDL